ncbi:transcription initiation factor TFIID subunit 4 isoform X5 [Armigeres subalbatus]|uniref:transcription initiation factor TFIID subunit 4 isoform X5 n=1 Tax=Armigeres subalbatus TaxID=124917 RepID=UPI002ED423A0
MASANFLEEALKSDVDESAVSAIVGTLENQLDQSSTTQVQQVAKNFECGNGGNSINSAIVSNGGTTPIYSAVQQQKHSNHGVANGEIVSNVMNSSNITNNNNNNNNSKTFIIATGGGQNVINSAGSGATTVVLGKNITVSSSGGGIQPSSTPPALISTVPTVSSSSGINIISNQIVVSAGGPPPPPFHVTSNSISNINNNATIHHQTTNMPKNEPVKLVYPAHGGGAGTPNAGTQAVLSMNNNRVTLTSTALPNGTISLSQAPQLIQTGATGKTTIQATSGGQPVGPGQPQTLIIKNQQTGAVMNSGAPGIVTMSKPINNQATQNIVGLPAGVQIVNVRPSAPPTQQAQQKTVAAVSPRVVIGSQQIVSTRPPNANITLSALQGQPGSTLLLKNEQGQFQLLRIGPAPAGTQITPANITATSGTNQTIRLQTVPAAQIRPVTQTIVTQNSIVGQTQIRMLTTQSGAPTVPRIGQTTIRPATPVRIQTPLHQQPHHVATTVATPSGPRQITAQQIRPNATATVGHTTIVQTSQQLPQTISTTPPALLPIRAPAGTAITRTPATLQIRATTPTVVSRSTAATNNTTVTTKTIRSQTPAVASVAAAAAAAAAAASGSTATQVKQVTAISNSNVVVAASTPSTAPGLVVTGTQPLPALALSSSAVATLNNASISNNSTSLISTSIPSTATVVVSTAPSISTANTSSTTSNNSSANQVTTASTSSSSTTVTTSSSKSSSGSKSQSSTAGTKKKANASAAASSAESNDPLAVAKKAAASMQSSFYQHHVSSSMYGDDDINDVAAMGGVNLAEETQRILGSTEFVGTQIRSCKDEVFLHMSALQTRIRGIVARHGLEEPSSEVAVLISHACQERLKNIVEKLAVVAEHRIDIIKVDPRYEVTKDVRGQIKFLEELDKAEQKRHEEQEREMLMRAAKSRSKTEDPEQAKLKAKAKEMQRAEMEELRQRDANLTALQAIGPRKKPKLEEGTTTPVTPGTSGIGVGVSGKTATPLRPRIKRVNLRDMLFYLEQEKESCRSQMLYKAYLK